MVGHSRCRVCQSELRKSPALSFSGLPGAAQHLPTQADLAIDKPISLDIIVCEACGVVQTLNPAVSYFREVIRASGYSEEMRAHRHEQFARLIEKYDLKGKKILEVGCGRGENLEILDALEISATGVEFGPEAIQHVNASGLSAIQMFFEPGDEV
ncbi:MAG TPA: methyltransferase domain-containing protein, partial [Dehalococcoidia bacterium]|nr:methyltransferase domain-containing protein [Dehalococcoidia bacterium]